jgi:23S rRNA (cytosine1962-C5)-methyltransferase
MKRRSKKSRSRASSSAPRPRSSLPTRRLETDSSEAAGEVILRGHLSQPQIFRKQIHRVHGDPEMGSLVGVKDSTGETVGFGMFNPKSEIRVRLLSRGALFPRDFWQARVRQAVEYRRKFLGLDSRCDVYRVVHSEGDGLPGLMVDRYRDILSVEVFTPGMLQRAESLLALLHPLCETSHHRIRCAPHSLGKEGFSILPHVSGDCPENCVVEEHGVKFRIEFPDSHKTGFFCDQRENRLRLADFCPGKTVLDLCCYSGGFSMYAAVRGQARQVTGIDLDEDAIATARQNETHNRSRVHWVHADIFPWMREAIAQGRRFDVVVLDPPKLINHRGDYEKGSQTHFDMNRLAMQLVAPGGLLLTCSCSGLLGGDEFFKLVCAASRQAGEPLPGQPSAALPRRGVRPMKVFERTSAGPDHPVAGDSPGTAYLDAVWCLFE